MTAGALRLWVLLALRMRCVTLLALPLDRGTAPGREHGVDTETGSKKLDGLLHLKDLPRGPALAPNKKAPQFMLDLFNAMTVSEGRAKSQKEILEGNTVRSFEDKGNSGERFHFFNLSSVGREERMIKAEFRWFRKKQSLTPRKSFGPHFIEGSVRGLGAGRVKPWRGNLISLPDWCLCTRREGKSQISLPNGSARSPSYPRESRELMDTTTPYLVPLLRRLEDGSVKTSRFLGNDEGGV
ncbi:uncharacterized protein [Notothenia coriiceps]|uniref:TGF-beta propeptide domain-containing protein n=1 Tax=Notothenia coriiceps TaxID=8208 RepID=A0A6I9PP46_9TELE|nr:PREDICTED: uncharacterized protein LOC104963088 [Notothenia coriiceps]